MYRNANTLIPGDTNNHATQQFSHHQTNIGLNMALFMYFNPLLTELQKCVKIGNTNNHTTLQWTKHGTDYVH